MNGPARTPHVRRHSLLMHPRCRRHCLIVCKRQMVSRQLSSARTSRRRFMRRCMPIFIAIGPGASVKLPAYSQSVLLPRQGRGD